MEDLIPLINKLQSVFKKTGMEEIKLPQIVVVGAQSAGKSSVLESLVKKSFLPRGTGIVTRCPFILQLHHVQGEEEWCEFPDHCGDEKFTNFEDARVKIEELQVIVAGNKKGISHVAIIVQVFSPKVIDLTVVDLPGIVKVPAEGQPADIEQQVHSLIMKYIRNESAIILAVSAANADIATSESLKLAKEVDPDGDRTIAVATKLDLMDKGTDASSVLLGEVIKVKLGIIGVINRSQLDIMNNTSVEDALEKEEAFLDEHYPLIFGKGSRYLATRLNELLKDHIRKCLPDLIERVRVLADDCTKEIRMLGPQISTKQDDCNWLIMEASSKFAKNFENAVRYHCNDIKGRGESLAVSANQEFAKLREDIVIDKSSFTAEVISQALKNTQNMEGYSSMENVFKGIVKEEIKEMKYPCIACAEEIHSLLSSTAKKCFEDSRLKQLKALVENVMDDVLDSQLKIVVDEIEKYFKRNTGMIFSSNPEFIQLLNGSVSVSDETDGNDSGDSEDSYGNLPNLNGLPNHVPISNGTVNKEKRYKSMSKITSFPMSSQCGSDALHAEQIVHIQNLIQTYLENFKLECCDYMPKTYMFHLAEETIKIIVKAIKNAVSGKEVALVAEPESVRSRRTYLQQLLTNLEDAKKILKEIRSS